MKGPSLDLSAVSSFAMRHGEKLVVGVVAIGALVLVWSGVSSLQALSVSEALSPQAVARAADQARAHVDREPQPPADLLPARTPLAEALDAWRMPMVPWRAGATPWLTVADPPAVAVLDNPLFQEAARRGSPDVFPIEDLRAVAGLAILAAPGGGQVQPGEAAERRRIVPYVVVTGLIPVKKQEDAFATCFSGAGFRTPETDVPQWLGYRLERMTLVPGDAEKWETLSLPRADGGRGPADAAAQAVNVPAAFVLGPPRTEYSYIAALPQRFDAPWGVAAYHPWFLPRIRQATADVAEEVDLKSLRSRPDDYVGKTLKLSGNLRIGGDTERVENVGLFTFRVSGGDQVLVPKNSSIGSGAGLAFAASPKFGEDFLQRTETKQDYECALRVRVDRVGKTLVARILRAELGASGDAEADVFEEPLPEPVNLAGDVPGGTPVVGAESGGEEYRLFRFIDTTVKPGQQYRYRVKFALRNPNRGVPRQHLVDPAVAKAEVLVSKESNATSTVAVPELTTMLVRPFSGLTKTEMKRFKSGMVEVLVLAESQKTSDYALGSLATETGGLVNVDSGLNKPGDVRSLGENVRTNRVLVDVRGRQDERPAPGKAAGPAEPLEMLFLRSDGSCELATAADSEELFDRYRGTLPRLEDPKTRTPGTSGEPTGLPGTPGSSGDDLLPPGAPGAPRRPGT